MWAWVKKGVPSFLRFWNSPRQEPVVLIWWSISLRTGRFSSGGIAVEDVARAADKLAGLIAEHGVKGRVGVDDMAAPVGDRHPFGHVFQHQGLGAQDLFGFLAPGDVFGQAR